ncbi:hypothetical protein LCGC14_2727700, partial [marine sediment metagenome]
MRKGAATLCFPQRCPSNKLDHAGGQLLTVPQVPIAVLTPTKRELRPLKFGCHFFSRHWRFEYYWDVFRHQTGNPSEREHGFEVQWLVFALGTDGTEMDLFEPCPESDEHGFRFTHRWIDLSGVTNVEAQGCSRKHFEHLGKLACCTATRFPLIHVFYANRLSEWSPQVRCAYD